LVRVKVRVLVPLRAMVVGLKALEMPGGATTVKEALAVFPVPPFVELTAPVALL
jgi:hypothetical protein